MTTSNPAKIILMALGVSAAFLAAWMLVAGTAMICLLAAAHVAPAPPSESFPIVPAATGEFEVARGGPTQIAMPPYPAENSPGSVQIEEARP